MRLEFTKFVSAISRSTDFVEAEILDIPPYHEKRVAVMSHAIGAYLGMDDETLYALTMAAALHDCAISEYLQDELIDVGYAGYADSEIDMANHCIAGEAMLLNFPFYHKVEGAILHHHDRADGSGALGTKAEDTPIYGQIVHIADRIDARFGLDVMDPDKYQEILEVLTDEERDRGYTAQMCDAFVAAVDYDLLCNIAGDGCVRMLEELVPPTYLDVPMPVMKDISTFFAHITDYKSHFTWQHSLGIAEKAERMASYYGYEQELCDKLFIAGALHDIGKLLINNSILEKPGRLTDEEYRIIKNHAQGTWELLHDIDGLEDICRWASNHHEKLDGSGYPRGLTADELDKHDRLLACLDIYQALVEERPYKRGMTHEEAVAILNKMGNGGQLDKSIIEDIDHCLGRRASLG